MSSSADTDVKEEWQIKSIASGSASNCIVFNNGRIKCWGFNTFGQLGLGDLDDRGDNPMEMGNNLPFIRLGINQKAINTKAGYAFSCVELESNQMKCWGRNLSGQLGQGHGRNIGAAISEMGDNLPVIRLGAGNFISQFVIGQTHVCVLIQTLNVVCFGSNTYGQLGIGGYGNRGKSPDHMGAGLIPVNFGKNYYAQSAFTSGVADHNCALLDNSKIKCWGLNNFGQLGYGDINNRGDEPGEMGDNLPFVDIGTDIDITNVYLGGFHTCAMLVNKKVRCWGRGTSGQLANGLITNLGDDMDEMGASIKPMMLGTMVYAVDISLGMFHSCALLNNGALKCFGMNDFGQTGSTSDDIISNSTQGIGDDAKPINFGTSLPITHISCGRLHTCVVFDDKYIKCFGNGENGRLGYGDILPRGGNIDDMGVNLPFVDLLSFPQPTSAPSTSATNLTPPKFDSVSEQNNLNYSTIVIAIVVPVIVVAFLSVFVLLCRKRLSSMTWCKCNCAKKIYVIFICHNQEETAVASQYMEKEISLTLHKRANEPKGICVDSNISSKNNVIAAHIKKSAVMVVLLSKNIFFNVRCLIELHYALEYNIPIVFVNVKGSDYVEENGLRFLNNLTIQTLESDIGTSTTDLLSLEIDVSLLGASISTVLANRPMLQFDMNGLEQTMKMHTNIIFDSVIKLEKQTPVTSSNLNESHESNIPIATRIDEASIIRSNQNHNVANNRSDDGSRVQMIAEFPFAQTANEAGVELNHIHSNNIQIYDTLSSTEYESRLNVI